MSEGYGAVPIGSGMSGGVQNVHIHDCRVTGGDQGIRLKSMRGHGGFVENVPVENVYMAGPRREAIVLNMFCRWLEDGSAAVKNMHIAATALGHSTSWLQGYTMSREEEFKVLLKIPAEKRLLTLVPVGVPVQRPTIEKKTLKEVIHWERYSR